MRRTFLLSLAFVLSCSTPAVSPDHARARASLVYLSTGVRTAAKVCTVAAQHMSRRYPVQATELSETCVRALIPARDAVVFAIVAADPWIADAGAQTACAGKAVALAMRTVAASLDLAGERVPPVMQDAVLIGDELGGGALPACDPLHPTTTVTVTVDQATPDVQPEYPR